MAKMLTTKDVQDLLHVDRSTVYRMVDAGRLPAVKVGKQWRFPAGQIETWLQRQAAVPVPTPMAVDASSGQDLASLLPLACVQLIQDSFAEALGVMIVLTDMAGNPVTEVSNPCGLYKVINQHPEALKKCIEGWGSLADILDLEPRFTQSHLGLLSTRAMVRIGIELKGMVVLGGIAPETWPPAGNAVAAIAAEVGLTAETIQPYLEEVFYLSEAQRGLVLAQSQRIANILTHIVAERTELLSKLKTIADLVS